MDLSLLPDADVSMPCAVHARGLEVDPGGSAIHADIVVAVEVPLPWPKPVFDHPLLAGLDSTPVVEGLQARILAAVPMGGSDALGIVGYRRTAVGATRVATHVPAGELRGAVDDALAALAGSAAGVPEPSPLSSPELWLCTQGSHDRCCGADGTRLANQLAAIRPDLVVRRVSHTGGHRFAPTALSLPDGRMWGYLDAAAAITLVDHDRDAVDLADRCRGWWGAATGPAQIAERAAFALHGWSWDAHERSVAIVGTADDGASTVVRVRGVDAHGAVLAHDVVVGVAREVPTIACGAPGGLPAKTGLEYEVLEVRPTSDAAGG